MKEPSTPEQPKLPKQDESEQIPVDELENLFVDAAQASDEEESTRLFTQFYEQSLNLTRWYLWDYGVHGSDIEDVSQTVYEKLLRGIDGYKDMSRFGGYFKTVCLNTARDYHRGRNREKRFFPDIRVGAPETEDYLQDSNLSDQPEEAVDVIVINDVVRTAVDKMSDEQAATFILTCLNGLSDKEAAEFMGIRENAVRARRYRARNSLKQSLEPFQETVA